YNAIPLAEVFVRSPKPMKGIKQREGLAAPCRLSRRTRRKWTDKQTPAATIPAARVRQNCFDGPSPWQASVQGLTRWRHLAATMRTGRSAMVLGSEYGRGHER